MADTSHAGEHHGPTYAAYMTVAAALAGFTVASFIFNSMQRSDYISTVTSFLLILGVAIIKATLVALVFMHLKWDWRSLYFLLIPVFIMGAMMMMVLMPDIFLGNLHDAQDQIQIASELSSK